MTTAGDVVPEHLRCDVETLWNYHRIDDELRTAEVGIGLGSHDLGVATHVANLHHAGCFPIVVFTGANAPSTVERFPRGEAVHYREHAVALGVPSSAILIEPEATNTGENLTKTVELLAAHGIEPSSVIIASRPYQQRRVSATAGRLMPDVEVMCTALPVSLDDYVHHIGDVDKVIDFLVGDTQRIVEYANQGYALAQSMPEPVIRAFSNLVRRGFTRRLVDGAGPYLEHGATAFTPGAGG